MKNVIGIYLLCLIVTVVLQSMLIAQQLRLNEHEYFEAQGFNVFVFNNQYTGFFFDEKTAGIEIIHHGIRTATGGAVRLRSTPEQWDLVPVVVDRKVDKENNRIIVVLRYDDYDFQSTVEVKGIERGIIIRVFLDKPLPKELEDHAGFNLEFLPSAYFEKTFIIDGKPGIFPLAASGFATVKPLSKRIPQFGGFTTFDDRGLNEYVDPLPFAQGKTITLAPEDAERTITITAHQGHLLVYDGRIVAQNGWFVVRTLFPSKMVGKVLEWTIEASILPGWVRQPNIGYSQVGYHPQQRKVAVIEIDKNDSFRPTAVVYRITPSGTHKKIFTSSVQPWGSYLRYKYGYFDFTSVRDPGLYCIEYGGERTKPFPIDTDVYAHIWQKTLGVWFPVQMDHMYVNEAYRVWHGIPYLDDALQAPVNHLHFDGYSMDSTTDTRYKPFERIPGLAVGGWFDAGDFDIQTASHCAVILSFVDTWEYFCPQYDQTFIDQRKRYVDIHRPDGVPDILQQIEHGTLQLVAQQKNIGHAVRGIVVGNLHQYHHLGDASTITDNLPYNPSLKSYETDSASSGTRDDRWVFTNRISWLNYYSVAALAAAARALKGYNDSLSAEALQAALSAWDLEQRYPSQKNELWGAFMRLPRFELLAALELYRTSGDERYNEYFQSKLWNAMVEDTSLLFNIGVAVRTLSSFGEAYKEKLRPFVERYKKFLKYLEKQNPYGLPIETHGWGSNSRVVKYAITNYIIHKYYPDVMSSEYVLRGIEYLFGCHPYSNISFVSGVGVQSKKRTYGNNRADFSFIPGGVVPGILILRPDYPENKEDWPFLWGENECVIDICAEYIFLANAVHDLFH
ncbi:MAG: glycoside hydrolase family 9 protein [Bacteroidetes bacterium]|nr:glycoside hydrolase family 9 protein [Bacteroidota bacterium]